MLGARFVAPLSGAILRAIGLCIELSVAVVGGFVAAVLGCPAPGGVPGLVMGAHRQTRYGQQRCPEHAQARGACEGEHAKPPGLVAIR